MYRVIWDYMAHGQRAVIRQWSEGLSPEEQAKLDVKLEVLRSLDFGMVSPKLVAGPFAGKIYKLRLHCKTRQLRPMLCRGPVGEPLDYTLLQGAFEFGDALDPADAPERAACHRKTLLENPDWREKYGERRTGS